MPDFPGNKAACCPDFPFPAGTVRHPVALVCLCLLVLLLGGSGVRGEDRVPADPRVARLNHAGFKSRGHCTGFSTRAGTLITAAHCLPKIRTDTVHVLLGYESGRLARHVRTPATSYRIVKGRDIAALCGAVDPRDGFSLAATPPEAGTRVVVLGYGAPRAHALQKTACSVLSRPRDGLMRLDCPLPPGTSGAPVMVPGSRKIVGVVSASSATGSLASRLPAGMTGRLCK